MYDGTDTVVLFDELALDDVLPCAWQLLAEPLSTARVNRHAEINQRMLQAALLMDDQIAGGKTDTVTPQSIDLARLDAKMNLLLDMVGRLLAQQHPRPSLSPVRFNIQGASWSPGTDDCQVNSKGIFKVYLHECLVDPLCLSGTVTSRTAQRVELKFDPNPEAVVDLLEKYIFRRHRRQVADAKKTPPTESMHDR